MGSGASKSQSGRTSSRQSTRRRTKPDSNGPVEPDAPSSPKENGSSSNKSPSPEKRPLPIEHAILTPDASPRPVVSDVTTNVHTTRRDKSRTSDALSTHGTPRTRSVSPRPQPASQSNSRSALPPASAETDRSSEATNPAESIDAEAGSNIGAVDMERLLQKYMSYIFHRADLDQDEVLSQTEFVNLILSQTLDLRLSRVDAEAMFEEYKDPQVDGVTRVRFDPLIRRVIDMYCAARRADDEPGWQWFGMYFDDDPDSLPAYYDTQARAMTYDRPADFTNRHVVETQQFEDVELTDGTVLTTCFDDRTGARLYLDFESGEWFALPAEWEDSIVRVGHSDDALNGDPATSGGQLLSDRDLLLQDALVMHPLTGEEYECVVEDGERLFFDHNAGEWCAMPVALELHVPAVAAVVASIQERFPRWTSTREILYALRMSGYHPDVVMADRESEEQSALMLDASGQPAGAAWASQEGTTAPTQPRKRRGRYPGTVPSWEEAQRQVEALQQELAEQRAAAHALQQEIESKNNLAEHRKQLLADAQAELLQLQDSNDAAKRAMHAEQTENSVAAESWKLKAEQLQQQYDEAIVELEGVRGGGDLQQTLQARDAALAEAREKNTTLQLELESSRQQLEVLQTEAADSAQAAQAHRQRAQGMASLLGSLRETAIELRGNYKVLKESVKEQLVDAFSAQLVATSRSLQDKAAVAIEEATADLRSKYRYEFRQRKLLYNQLQEIRGNIRVFCRVRRDDRVSCALSFPDEKNLGGATQVSCPNTKSEAGLAKTFEFERVFGPDSTQEEVFLDTEAIITSCVDGYNVCLIAYGQTGSGKTYTMMGTPENPGVNRRAVKELIRIMSEREHIEYEMQVSLMEIYNEKIIDLLSTDVSDNKCDIRLDPKTKLPFVADLIKRPVKTEAEVLQALADGDNNRHVASTKMNSHSSRSHLLLQIYTMGRDSVSGEITRGKLTLVDLAGSERVAKTDATGQRLVEAAAINKSLSSLGQVFGSLRSGQGHVPYRNCKLTHILEDSLGGDAKTCVFVNVSPADSNLAETVGTLQFGTSIRQIELNTNKKKKSAKR